MPSNRPIRSLLENRGWLFIFTYFLNWELNESTRGRHKWRRGHQSDCRSAYGNVINESTHCEMTSEEVITIIIIRSKSSCDIERAHVQPQWTSWDGEPLLLLSLSTWSPKLNTMSTNSYWQYIMIFMATTFLNPLLVAFNIMRLGKHCGASNEMMEPDQLISQREGPLED